MSEAAAPGRRTAAVPSPVLGEIGYLLQSRVGPQAEVTFLKSFGDDGFHIAELEDHDIRRMAELVETFTIPYRLTCHLSVKPRTPAAERSGNRKHHHADRSLAIRADSYHLRADHPRQGLSCGKAVTTLVRHLILIFSGQPGEPAAVAARSPCHG